MALRLIKISIALAIGLWGLVGLLGNLVSLSDTYSDVLKITSMANVPAGEGPPWGTDSPIIVGFGVLSIVLGKAAAVLCGWGGVQMIRALNAASDDFTSASYWAYTGAIGAFLMMFFSFTLMAESVFFMFYTPSAPAGELAFRFAASFALAALILRQKDV